MRVVAFEDNRGLHPMPGGQEFQTPQVLEPEPGLTNPGSLGQRRVATERGGHLTATEPLRRRQRRTEPTNLYSQALALVSLMPPSEHLEWYCQDAVSQGMTQRQLEQTRDSNPMFAGIEVQSTTDDETQQYLVAIHNYRA